MVRNIIFVLSKMGVDGRMEGFSRVCELTFYDDEFVSTSYGTSIFSMTSDFSKSFPELNNTEPPYHIVYFGELASILALLTIMYVIFFYILKYCFKMLRLERNSA